MSFKIINLRKRLIKSFISELIIFIILIYLNSIFFYKTNLFSFIYIGIWIVISYIIGRYHDFKKINKKTIFNHIIKTIFASIILINLSFIIGLITKPYLNNSFIFNYSLYFYFLLGIISAIVNFILNLLSNRNIKNKKWFILNENYLLDYLQRDNIENNDFFNKNFILIPKISEIDTNKIDEIAGIIVQKNRKLKDEEEKFLSDMKRIDMLILSNFEWCEKYLQRIPPKIIDEELHRGKILYPSFNIFEYRIKKIFEFCFSLILIVLTSPILIISAIFIYFEDRGSIFYSQIRTGIYGKKLRIYKLRTMRMNAEKDGIQWSSDNDTRITNVGKFLRKTRIDEIPQLISVLIGEMSLIGPRPERPEIDVKLIEEIPGYESRYNILPGISGWAQVNYPYGSSIKDSYNKLSYDLYYLRNFSIILDLIILFKTIRVVLKDKHASPSN